MGHDHPVHCPAAEIWMALISPLNGVRKCEFVEKRSIDRWRREVRQSCVTCQNFTCACERARLPCGHASASPSTTVKILTHIALWKFYYIIKGHFLNNCSLINKNLL